MSARKELEKASVTIKAKMWFWLAIGGLILAGLYFGFAEGWFDRFLK